MENPHNLEVFWSREIKGSKQGYDGTERHRSGDNFTFLGSSNSA